MASERFDSSPRPDASPDVWPFYCEESVWRRIVSSHKRGDRAVALWISNPTRSVAMWHQSLAPTQQRPILWDYHVVQLLATPNHTWVVDDPYSTLPNMMDASEWLHRCFDIEHRFPPQFSPRFRWIDGETYIRYFASDRRHMRDADGNFRQPPPPWDAILPERPSVIDAYCSDHPDVVGDYLTAAQLEERLRRPIL